MPKTIDVRPLPTAYRPPTENEMVWIRLAGRRDWRLPPGKKGTSPAGRKPVHDLSGWPVGYCLETLPDDAGRARSAARTRGMVVATIAPGVLARLA